MSNPKSSKKPGIPAVPKFPQTPKGMHDILPADQPYWDRVAKAMKDLAEFYNFGKIETPILEDAALFMRGVGEETDIVEKEMYTLKTKGGDVLALRPENTAGVIRAYLQNGMSRLGQPQKLWYIGPYFRHENPQAGRTRQFHQTGFEIVGGVNDPIYDAQIIIITMKFLETLKIQSLSLQVNSIGCRVCRPLYKKQLQAYYRNHEKSLCPNCQRRLKTNPLRLLDCKNEKCQPLKEKAPNILDKLCTTCSHHLKCVLEYLDEVGISYLLNNQLVRGLDYYSKTVFEPMVEGDGENLGSLGGGGRYDYLAEMIGGKSTPAVGVALGIERIIEVMKLQQVKLPKRVMKRVFVAHAGELAKKKCLKLIEHLREEGIPVFEALSRESLKAQLKAADKEDASLALIIGQKEVYEDSAIVRDLKTGLQESFPFPKMFDEVKKRLKAE